MVVVTGASMGIGAILAQKLSAKGAKVILVARSEDKLREVAASCQGGEASTLVIVADVTKRADHERILQEGISRFGFIDAWVNNAGRGITKSVLEITDEDFDDMMLVNTKSALYGMQTVMPHFKDRKAGHIINLSSMLGRIPFATMRSAYCAAKHALNSLTCSTRLEVQAMGLNDTVHVSLVSPGMVATHFGLNALHGGPDSREFPNAQPVEEVADVILDVLVKPRADEYTMPNHRSQVAAYFSAEDVGELESKPPFIFPVFQSAKSS